MIKEALGKAIMDKRTLIAIVVTAILWRMGISMNGEIALWESICSGIALFVMGWALFAHIFLRAGGVKKIDNEQTMRVVFSK